MELAPRFAALFAGLERAHGAFWPTKAGAAAGEKLKGKVLTKQEPVTLVLWEKHLAGKQGLGIIPVREDGTLSWAAIDVDVYPIDLVALEAKLREIRLPLVVVRTKSGGAHLYLFCAEPVAAKFIRAKLTEWTVLIGYPGVEIFPKQDGVGAVDTGNWLNMPYYNADDTTRYAIFDGVPLSAVDFLTLAEGRRVTKEALDAFVVSNADDIINNGPPCLQHLAKEGFPRGSRNRGLFNLGVLARFAGGDDWRDHVERFNSQFMQPPLSAAEVVTLQKSLTKKDYFYTCSQDPIASVCSKEICKGRKYGIGNTDTARAPVVIDNITKINSIPPMYVVAINGKSVQCTSHDLLSQPSFRRLVLEKTDQIIPMLKGPVWEALLAEKFSSLEIVEAPTDSGPEGQMLAFLQEFCTSWAHANNRDEILLGKPWLNPDDAFYYFRSGDFEAYLEHRHFRNFTGPERWEILRRHACEAMQLSVKGASRNVWKIPARLFTAQIEPHSIPQIPGAEL